MRASLALIVIIRRPHPEGNVSDRWEERGGAEEEEAEEEAEARHAEIWQGVLKSVESWRATSPKDGKRGGVYHHIYYKKCLPLIKALTIFFILKSD